jgi:hypothetical protein
VARVCVHGRLDHENAGADTRRCMWCGAQLLELCSVCWLYLRPAESMAQHLESTRHKQLQKHDAEVVGGKVCPRDASHSQFSSDSLVCMQCLAVSSKKGVFEHHVHRVRQRVKVH